LLILLRHRLFLYSINFFYYLDKIRIGNIDKKIYRIWQIKIYILQIRNQHRYILKRKRPFQVFVFFETDQDKLRDILLLMRLLSAKWKEQGNPSFPISQILNQDICFHLESIVVIQRIYYFFSFIFYVLRLQRLITAIEFFQSKW